jgi:hypothetical protein
VIEVATSLGWQMPMSPGRRYPRRQLEQQKTPTDAMAIQMTLWAAEALESSEAEVDSIGLLLIGWFWLDDDR